MKERSWKLFCVLPFLLLCLTGGQAHGDKEDLCRRFGLFGAGTWDTLFDEAVASIPQTTRLAGQRVLNMEERGKAARKSAV